MSLARPFNTRPLYQQVADEFISRIVSRTWAPGQAIENEADIARSLGISLGTVRKAFDILTEHKLLERQQGRGTIVADFEDGKMRGRFSNILDLEGNRVTGDIKISDVALTMAPTAAVVALDINPRTPVLRFSRRRTYRDRFFMVEEVFLRVDASAADLADNELLALAKTRWLGQDIATHMREKVSVTVPSPEDKYNLELKDEKNVLALERLICSYQNRPLELRYGRCNLGTDLTYTTN